MRLLAAYVAVVCIWSTTPLAMKLSTDSLDFTEAAGLRIAVAAMVCSLLMLLRRVPVPMHRKALQSYGSSVLGVFGGMLSAFWALQYVASGMISVMFGLAPIFSGIFAWLLLAERGFTASKLLGLLVAFAGLAGVFRSDLGLGPNGVPGILVAILGTVLFSLSSVLVKKTSAGIDAMAHVTGSLLMSLPLFALTWWLLDGVAPTEVTMTSLLAVAYLSLLGSVFGFVIFLYVLRALPASKVALVPLMTPVLALMLGARFAGEQVSPDTLAAAALILAGLAIYEFGGRLFR